MARNTIIVLIVSIKLIVEMNFPPRSFHGEGLAHIHALTNSMQQLIALGIDTYTGDVANYVAKDVDTSAGSMDDVMRDRFNKDIFHASPYR